MNGILQNFYSYLRNFPPKDIYDADKTGLYCRAIPNGSICFKHESIIESKKNPWTD